VYGEFSFPNVAEQEIVVVDLLAPNPGHRPAGRTTDSDIDLSWRSRLTNGLIDPRPAGAEIASQEFDVVFGRGTNFVVFADFYEPREFWVPQRQPQQPFRSASVSYVSSVWHFLTCLRQLVVRSREGNEMTADGTSDLGRLVTPFLQGSQYNCFFPSLQDWIQCSVIATNKHGDAVAITTGLAESNRIIILPQLANKSEFIHKLIVDFLPHRCPEFFPEFGAKGWVKEPEYELRTVLELNKKIEIERDEYGRKMRAIDEEISLEREKNGWMQDLLTGTGDTLVAAVKKALEALGFTKVKDVDAERDAAGQTRREDLQILDASPAIIVDVKGIGTPPGDTDIQQAGKHATMRMKEWKSTEVISLFVVNQEKKYPTIKTES
jgi:hypothetical protein